MSWPETGQVYRCRHCPKDIMYRAGYWTDADGIMYCQKRHRDPDGTLQDPILHEPMPVIPPVPAMLPASQLCTVHRITGGQPCRRMACWVWNPGGEPVFLCNHHREPFA